MRTRAMAWSAPRTGRARRLPWSGCSARLRRSRTPSTSELHGRGTYLVTATCETSNAWFHPGESLEPDAEPLPAQRAPAFLRAASTSFFLETPDYGWLPPGGDCDGNGISDEDEGATCIDGWSYCDGNAVQCIAYGSSTCNAHAGCNWIGFPVNFCYGAPRVCESYESEQTCEAVDGCDWETPYPCPPDPSSLDTNGNGILDACDPDNTGNDVPDPWEPPWCQLEGGPCSDDADCCPGNLLCSTTIDKCYADVSFQGG